MIRFACIIASQPFIVTGIAVVAARTCTFAIELVENTSDISIAVLRNALTVSSKLQGYFLEQAATAQTLMSVTGERVSSARSSSTVMTGKRGRMWSMKCWTTMQRGRVSFTRSSPRQDETGRTVEYSLASKVAVWPRDVRLRLRRQQRPYRAVFASGMPKLAVDHVLRFARLQVCQQLCDAGLACASNGSQLCGRLDKAVNADEPSMRTSGVEVMRWSGVDGFSWCKRSDTRSTLRSQPVSWSRHSRSAPTHHLAKTSSPLVAPRKGSNDDALVGREVVGATDGLAERGVREDARLTSRASRSASFALLRGSILAGRTCSHTSLRCVQWQTERSAGRAGDRERG